MDQPSYIRRCHICGSITESQLDRVDECDHCGRALAPFYYFDEKFIPVISEGHLRPPLVNNEYTPIQGLTAYW